MILFYKYNTDRLQLNYRTINIRLWPLRIGIKKGQRTLCDRKWENETIHTRRENKVLSTSEGTLQARPSSQRIYGDQTDYSRIDCMGKQRTGEGGGTWIAASTSEEGTSGSN